MKKRIIVALIIVGLILIAVWICIRSRHEEQSAYQGTTQVVLSGTTGVVVTGFYVQDGRRITLSNALPWSLEGERISSFEIRKLNPDDTLVVDMSYVGDGAHAGGDEEASRAWCAGDPSADSERIDFADSRANALNRNSAVRS